MKRGWSRTLLLTSLVPLCASLGCDALTVRSFAGTIMQLTLTSVPATPPGQHLELWATTQYNDIVRINPYYDLFKGKASFGLMIRPAVPLDSPCMINDKGYLLTDPAAYPGPVTQAGVTQSPEQQARQVQDRINQLTDLSGQPLLAVVPYDPTPEPIIPATATADERLATCNAYEAASDLTYVPNPLQITAPKHGTVYGFVSFASTKPPANYDGIRIDTPVNLKGIHELFLTVEGDTVDPKNRGPLYLISQRTEGGRDVVHFDLVHADPANPASGTAALYVDLDQDPVQF